MDGKMSMREEKKWNSSTMARWWRCPHTTSYQSPPLNETIRVKLFAVFDRSCHVWGGLWKIFFHTSRHVKFACFGIFMAFYFTVNFTKNTILLTYFVRLFFPLSQSMFEFVSKLFSLPFTHSL